jgi:hypothetical protein
MAALPRPIRASVATLVALALTALAATAQADEGDGDGEDDRERDDEPPDPAFRYTTEARANVLRAVAEQVGLLLLGFAQYRTSQDQNARDWDLDYTWQDFRSKLLLSSVSFDNNRFDTNWLTHPAAGYLYYTSARANRLGIPASFAMSFASSTFWEYVGEFREQVSANDVISTPASGVVLGETATQLGALFHRSRPGVASTLLGWIFTPFKSAHDAIDGLEVERPTTYDDLGFPGDVWHRFRFGLSLGVTSQERGVTQPEGRVNADSRIVTLPDYGRAGQRSRWFSAGEVSSFAVRGALAGGELVDLELEAAVIAAGHYHQHVEARAGGLVGHGTVAGWELVTEYGRHSYDRDGRRPQDRIALVGSGGAFEQSVHAGPLTIRTRAHVLGGFAGVGAYAWFDQAAFGDSTRMPSVVRGEGYYHAYGVTVRPSIELEAGRLDGGADVRLDWFAAITGFDRRQFEVRDELQPLDRRARTRAWIGVRPLRHLRFAVTGERRERAGRIGDLGTSRSEVSLQAGVDVLF